MNGYAGGGSFSARKCNTTLRIALSESKAAVRRYAEAPLIASHTPLTIKSMHSTYVGVFMDCSCRIV